MNIRIILFLFYVLKIFLFHFNFILRTVMPIAPHIRGNDDHYLTKERCEMFIGLLLL